MASLMGLAATADASRTETRESRRILVEELLYAEIGDAEENDNTDCYESPPPVMGLEEPVRAPKPVYYHSPVGTEDTEDEVLSLVLAAAAMRARVGMGIGFRESKTGELVFDDEKASKHMPREVRASGSTSKLWQSMKSIKSSLTTKRAQKAPTVTLTPPLFHTMHSTLPIVMT